MVHIQQKYGIPQIKQSSSAGPHNISSGQQKISDYYVIINMFLCGVNVFQYVSYFANAKLECYSCLSCSDACDMRSHSFG